MSTLKTRWDRKRVAFETKGPVIVDQSDRDKVNINKIIERARRTGIWPTPNRSPIYADVSSAPKDLLSAFAVVESAKEAFMTLPAKLRRELNDDPRNLEPWLADEANAEQAEKYGLITPKMDAVKLPESDFSSQGEATPPKSSQKRSQTTTAKTRGSETADEGTGT